MTNQEIVDVGNYQRFLKEWEDGYENVLSHLHGTDVTQTVQYGLKREYYYFRVEEIAYEAEESTMERILYAAYSLEIEFIIAFICEKGELQIYIGADESKIVGLYRIMNGSLLVLSGDLEDEISRKVEYGEYYSSDFVFQNHYHYSGIIRGDFLKEKQEIQANALIDDLTSGMLESSFALVIAASPFEKSRIIEFAEDWSELRNQGELIKTRQISRSDGLDTISYSDISYKVANYLDIIDGYYKKYSEAIGKGMWEVSVKYYAETEELAEAAAGIVISGLYSEGVSEPVHRIRMGHLEFDDRLLTNISSVKVDNGNPMPFPMFSNWYSTHELSILVDFPHKDTYGVTVRKKAQFDMSQKSGDGLALGRIQNRGRETRFPYQMDINELNRHTLVVGLTGGGKTNTLKSILMEIYNKYRKIPFMVIEPAKKEYWELYKLGCESLKIYSFGSSSNNLALNPFQKCGNISVQTHIDNIFAAFKASFIMYPPMPYVLERAIYAIYEDCGWDIENDRNVLGELYPTIEQLYLKIPYIVSEIGYDQREQKNIVGALQARINSLRLGIKGKCLNVKQSYPIERLLGENTIIELENIGDEETKAFIMSLILIQVSEYRMGCEDAQKELRHLILFEEAHRLLKNIPAGSGENADPRGNAVEMFCNMLAELRSKGQGFIIADQIPSKLAVDTIKNTNLKIVHRIVAEEDRSLMGKCMHMDQEQIEYLSTLSQGVGAVYAEGDYNPKLVKAAYAGKWQIAERKGLPYREVLERCSDIKREAEGCNQKKLDTICALCPFVCDGIRSKELYEYIRREDLEKLARRLEQNFDKGMFTVVIGECLREIREGAITECYWSYAFCCVKEIMKCLDASSKSKYKIFMDLLQLLSCMSGAPSSWKER